MRGHGALSGPQQEEGVSLMSHIKRLHKNKCISHKKYTTLRKGAVKRHFPTHCSNGELKVELHDNSEPIPINSYPRSVTFV